MNELNLTMPQLLLFMVIMCPLVVYLWMDLLVSRPEDKQHLAELLEVLETGGAR